MRLLRPDLPVGVSVWRDVLGGPIVEAAYVWDGHFVWCGSEGRTPPRDITALGARRGREVFWVYDDEKGDLVAGAAPGFLRSLVAAGFSEPCRLRLFFFPSGKSETVASGDPLDLDRPADLGIVPRWNDPVILHVKGGRIAKHRRHQSWYRENVLKAPPGAYKSYAELGSYLDEDAVTKDPSLNFLTAEAEAHAVERAAVVKAKRGALDPVRLRRNMLASMPLCFNLFGSLRREPAFLTLFRRMFDPMATRIVDVLCDFAPQPTSDFLDDGTAFDAVVFYETASGPRFMGIETKYTEPFSQTKYESDRYNEVTAACGWFADPDSAPATLKGSKSNQLWRNVLLAASLEHAETHGAGSVAVVALEDDPGAAKAIRILCDHLTAKDRLHWAPIERILDAADGIADIAPWSAAFRLRYVP